MIITLLLNLIDGIVKTLIATLPQWTFNPSTIAPLMAFLHYLYTLDGILPITLAVVPIIGLYALIITMIIVKIIIVFCVNVLGFNGARL